jgi:hypothetical protein
MYVATCPTQYRTELCKLRTDASPRDGEPGPAAFMSNHLESVYRSEGNVIERCHMMLVSGDIEIV